MSVLEPDPDEDPIDAEIADEEEETDALLAALEMQLSDIVVDENEVENVQGLSKKALLTHFAAVQRELREISEMHYPQTQRGRDLHSRLAAYQHELKRRKMK